MALTIEEMNIFCRKKGFVFNSADIYGGLSGFFDYAPLGVELKNNLKQAWYKFIVQNRRNVVAQDGSIITNPKVWKASGHLDGFADLVLTTKKSKTKLRADHFIEDNLNINAEGLSAKEINELIVKHNLNYKGEEFEEVKDFNLMFSTQVGAAVDGSNTAYLRPETCQSIFPNFKLIMEISRQKLPFGIAQIGKAFRNEISPRDFLFRQREFEQMELEFFINPKDKKCPELTEKHLSVKFNFLSAKNQDAENMVNENSDIKSLLEQGSLSEWHAYWLSEMYFWYTEVLKFNPENLRIREHIKTELSHYSSATFDLDYKFPNGFKEILGIADRGQFDLKQHMIHSKSKLDVIDEETKERFIPSVIEPSQGLDRLFLAVLFEAFKDDKDRGNIVLKLASKLAPTFCAVFPLVRNKPEIVDKAKEIHNKLKTLFPCFYDQSGSVGRRYARQDEIGTPFCVTVDFESLEDDCVTVRNRDTTEQERIKIDELPTYLLGMWI
jgi:glycyl-tRNA synthetase